MPLKDAEFEARPLTPATWPDLEELFGLPGGSIVRGCWCMYFRRSGPSSAGSFDSVGAERKQAMCDLVDSGVVPGLIGYLDGSPAGWISLGPREGYAKLRRSKIMKAVDDTPCWSVICSYVPKQHRGQGLQHELLRAAIDYARAGGATVLEAYPVDYPGRVDANALFFGSRELYERAGFTEVVRRSPTRVVMRLDLTDS
jgi:GNAT superfamily N-acetyltransferase